MEEKKNVSNPPGAIYRAIPGVMSDVGAVSRDKVNKQQGWKFRSIDDVFNALHPALAKNKVFIVPTILDRKEQVFGKTKNGMDMVKVVCKIKYEFYAEDGSSVTAIAYGEGLDTGDKATNKAMATAYKYACFQVFCIPTEEMKDPDIERPEIEEEEERMEKPAGKSKGGKTAKKAKENKAEPDKPGAAPEQLGEVEGDGGRITEAMLNTIRSEQKRTGVSDRQILGIKAVSAKAVPELTVKEFKVIMNKFKATGDLDRGGAQDE
ncbi:ERF family protein [Faecalimonas umbilicata]|nr:ERF family protein [Faecalimonas umbilicata]